MGQKLRAPQSLKYLLSGRSQEKIADPTVSTGFTIADSNVAIPEEFAFL